MYISDMDIYRPKLIISGCLDAAIIMDIDIIEETNRVTICM